MPLISYDSCQGAANLLSSFMPRSSDSSSYRVSGIHEWVEISTRHFLLVQLSGVRSSFGLRGEVLAKYAKEWLLGIEDVK